MQISEFQKQVYGLTAKIPLGKVSTYKMLAQALKKPQASRAVGNALNKNPFAPQVPCHRVIRSNGEIGGFANGSQQKKILLKKEGLEIVNNKIDLVKYGYKFTVKK